MKNLDLGQNSENIDFGRNFSKISDFFKIYESTLILVKSVENIDFGQNFLDFF